MTTGSSGPLAAKVIEVSSGAGVIRVRLRLHNGWAVVSVPGAVTTIQVGDEVKLLRNERGPGYRIGAHVARKGQGLARTTSTPHARGRPSARAGSEERKATKAGR